MSRISKKMFAAKLLSQYEHWFQCPICSSPMTYTNPSSLVCTNGHRYDLAKKGYLHMLSQSSQTKYDKDLFVSRKKVIESGFFTPIIEKIVEIMDRTVPKENQPIAIYDAGCGEGTMLSKIQSIFPRPTIGFGIDISKEGIQQATDHETESIWLVSDIANSPIRNDVFHSIINILSPSNYAEFTRLIKQDGILLKVVPNPHYLQELRNRLYDHPEQRIKDDTTKLFERHFDLMQSAQVQYEVEMKQPLLQELVNMTPLSWSASPQKLADVHSLQSMNITVDVTILVGKTK